MFYFTQENHSRSKLLQFVSGAKVITFWLTAFIWDYITFLITIIIFALAFVVFQEPGWSSTEEISRIVYILAVFAFATLPVTYIASLLFTIPASGFTRLTMFYVFTGRHLKIIF